MIRTAKSHSIHEISPDLYDNVLASSNLRTTQVFNAEWDDEGVYFYQAYRDEIADYALEHQRFGGEHWNPSRMTWIKPSFGWVLYRSGYGGKAGQERILKVKLGHAALAELLCRCKLACSRKASAGNNGETTTNSHDTNHAIINSRKKEHSQAHELKEGSHNIDKETCTDSKTIVRVGGKGGRIQWDPERDLSGPENLRGKRQPRKMIRTRAIQIGLSAGLSEYYVENVLSIEDVTALAHAVEVAHRKDSAQEVKEAMPWDHLPNERPYMPELSVDILLKLGMLPKYVDEWRQMTKDSSSKI